MMRETATAKDRARIDLARTLLLEVSTGHTAACCDEEDQDTLAGKCLACAALTAMRLAEPVISRREGLLARLLRQHGQRFVTSGREMLKT